MKFSKGSVQARDYALRLIKFRLRSEKELKDKLKAKEYTQDVIDSTIDRLKKSKLIDDALFARLWVDSRIKIPLGLARLSYELKVKGIDKNIIEEALDRAKENYNQEEQIRETIERKLKGMKNLPAEKKMSRLFGFLARRGFPKGMIAGLLMEYIKSSSGEVLD